MTAIQILSEIGGDMSVFPQPKTPSPEQDIAHAMIKAIVRSNQLGFPVLVLILNQFWYKFTDRYRQIKAHRGHKKAIIAICRMLLTAIWHILSDLRPYTADSFLEPRPVNESKVLTTSQALNLKQRGNTIKDDPAKVS